MEPVFISSPFHLWVLYIACLIWLVPEIIGSFFQRSHNPANKHDKGSLLLLGISKGIGIYFAFIFSLRDNVLAFPWNPFAWYWIGIMLILGGVSFRWYSIRILGKSFTRNVAVQDGQVIVQDGPYRLIRHPSYTGTLIASFGLGLTLGNWLSLLCTLTSWAIGHAYRVYVEENALVENLGKPYQDYMQHTHRFIPYLF
jgi:protein-S-isoprenylcysteine O-methyltransferase Ste14